MVSDPYPDPDSDTLEMLEPDPYSGSGFNVSGSIAISSAEERLTSVFFCFQGHPCFRAAVQQRGVDPEND